MSLSGKHAIAEIKRRLNLADIARRYVQLRRTGSRWMAACPFHQEVTPSFSIHEEEGYFYCFGCQASGDLFDFYARIHGISFRETLEQLAEEAGVSLEALPEKEQKARSEGLSQRKQALKAHELAAAQFARHLATHPQAEACRAYVAKRGISPEIMARFGLGYSLDSWQSLADALKSAGFSDNLGVEASLLGKSAKSGRAYDRFRGRLMFPIRNLSGQVIAFGGRIIDSSQQEEAKYINSSDSPVYKKGEHLYGLNEARKALSTGQPAMLTEGYMDVLTLHQFGYESAVGVLGTALTDEQIKRISGFTSQIELLFDADRAGRKAAMRSAEMLLIRGLSCKVVLLPDGEDIDSLLKERGKEFFESLRHSAPAGIQFCAQVLRDMAPRDAIDWARSFLQRTTLPELTSRYASVLATNLGLTEDELRGHIATKAPQRGTEPNTRQAPPVTKSDTRDRQIMTFAVRYPHALPKLREAGGYLALSAAWAKDLWEKIEHADKAEDLFSQLEDKEKRFWIVCRTSTAPLTNEEGELTALSQMLERQQLARQSASFSAALRQSQGDYELDETYLKALQHTLNQRKIQHELQKGDSPNGEH